MLSLLLGRDGGPREGAIRLQAEKPLHAQTIPEVPEEEPITPLALEEDAPQTVVGTLKKKVSKKLSGYFANRVYDAQNPSSPGRTPPVPLVSTPRQGSMNKGRSLSRTSRMTGSAYGYGANNKNTLASSVSQSFAGRRGSLASSIARRRRTTTQGVDAQEAGQGSGMNFAQRLLMANENVVTGIADLWVAAAINADNEDVFLSDDEGSVIEDDDEDESSPTRAGRSPTRSTLTQHRFSNTSAMRVVSPRRSISLSMHQGDGGNRRASATVPAIFAHTGVRAPSVTEPASPATQPLLPREDVETGPRETLVPIVEHQAQHDFNPPQPADEPLVEAVSEKSPSMFSLLPVMIILQ